MATAQVPEDLFNHYPFLARGEIDYHLLDLRMVDREVLAEKRRRVGGSQHPATQGVLQTHAASRTPKSEF